MAPPLPIPNREVKRFSAYDTKHWLGTMGHCQKFSIFNLHPDLIVGIFCGKLLYKKLLKCYDHNHMSLSPEDFSGNVVSFADYKIKKDIPPRVVAHLELDPRILSIVEERALNSGEFDVSETAEILLGLGDTIVEKTNDGFEIVARKPGETVGEIIFPARVASNNAQQAKETIFEVPGPHSIA